MRGRSDTADAMIQGREPSALCRTLENAADDKKRYALVAVWSLYVWLTALLAARPHDLRVAMALAEVEDQVLPLLDELRSERLAEGI